MKTAVCYVRVSTTEQAEHGHSIENQISKLKAYCDLMNFDNVLVKTDAGISGKSTRGRVAFSEVLELAASKQIDAVVVYSLSRFARNTKDTLGTIETLRTHNVSFHSLSERIDTDSPTGRFFLTVMAGLAQLEREQTVSRIKDVLQHKKAQGQRVGQIPFGYRLAADGATLEQHEAEQLVISHVKELHATGLSYRAIAQELQQQLFQNKTGKTTWNATQIHRILKAAA